MTSEQGKRIAFYISYVCERERSTNSDDDEQSKTERVCVTCFICVIRVSWERKSTESLPQTRRDVEIGTVTTVLMTLADRQKTSRYIEDDNCRQKESPKYICRIFHFGPNCMCMAKE